MTVSSTRNSSSNFKDGKLKPGVYKIQNIVSETYLDIHLHSKKLCCRPAKDLEGGRGLWEIKRFGEGYTVEMLDPGSPAQFCTPMEGLENGTSLHVTAYPAAWRIETVDDVIHRGFGYVRFYWGPTKTSWDLGMGHKDNGTLVQSWVEADVGWQIWKLIPVPLPERLGSSSPPLYDEYAIRQSSTHAESEGDDFGTIVTEVTVVTTRKRYRVENA